MDNTKPTITECRDQIYLERVRYYPGQLLTAEDMWQEQQYFIEKLRRHNRFLHGWGIVCGLKVKAAPTAQAPLNALICPGYALGPYGDEIYLDKERNLDLATCLSKDEQCKPCEESARVSVVSDITEVYIIIKFSECKTRPQRTLPAGCGCDETVCEYSRILDSVDIKCLPQLPKSHSTEAIQAEASNKANELCPPKPLDPWLVLARVELPTAGNNIEGSNIFMDAASSSRRKLKL